MVAKSDRTKMIEESKIDPDEDVLTRGVRSAVKRIGYGTSRAADYVGAGAHAVGEYLNPKPKVKDVNAMQKSAEEEQEKRRETRGQYKPSKFTVPKILDEKEEKEKEPLLKRYKSGGSVSARADGCAVRGKTKGRMV